MCFMQTESVLQTKNRSGPAKNQFSVALVITMVKQCSPGSGVVSSVNCFNCLFRMWVTIMVKQCSPGSGVVSSVNCFKLFIQDVGYNHGKTMLSSWERGGLISKLFQTLYSGCGL